MDNFLEWHLVIGAVAVTMPVISSQAYNARANNVLRGCLSRLPPLLDVLKLSHMDTVLTSDEKKLVEYAKQAIIKYNTIRHAHGGIDTLYAFLLSDSGKIHDGACYEPILSHATVCGERHAIANMILQESYKAKIKSIVVADPVPEVQEHGRSPCGTCRHLIWSHGSPDTTVILIQYIQGKDGWTFPKLEKYTAKDFYPLP